MLRVNLVGEVRNFIFGVFLKTLGYLTIASGIFLAIGKPGIAIKFVYCGIILVAIGWIVIVKSLLSARGVGKREEKPKVSVFANGGIFGLRRNVELRGRVGKIVDGRFKENRGRIKVYLDDKFFGEFSVDGSFRIKLKDLKRGKHTAEVRFVEGNVNKRISFEVVDFKTWLKSFLAFASVFSILLSLLFLCVFIAF